MYKEIIISVIIVVSIFVLNSITYSYTKDSLEIMSNDFSEIKEELFKEEISKEKLSKKTEELIENWTNRSEKLAYFIEHDELEKVNTYLYAFKANVEAEDYEQAIENAYICEYIIDHIDEKEAFLLTNIF